MAKKKNVQAAIIEKPTEVVEKRLSDFVADAFNATNKDFAFQEKLKDELLKRFSSMTDAQIIALYSNNSVNLNDLSSGSSQGTGQSGQGGRLPSLVGCNPGRHPPGSCRGRKGRGRGCKGKQKLNDRVESEKR